MKKVKTKILTIILGVTIFILIASLVVEFTNSYKIVNNSMKTTLTLVAEQTSKNISSDISEIDDAILDMSKSAYFMVESDEIAASNVTDYQKLKGINQVSLYDLDGNVLGGNFDSDIDFGTVPEFKEAIETGEARHIMPVKLPDDAYYYLAIFPVLKNNEVIRVIVAPFAYEKLNSVVEGYTIGKKGNVYLINKQGSELSVDNLANTVLSGAPIDMENVNSDKDKEALHQEFVKNTESEYIKQNIDGEAYVAAKAYNESLGCFVVISMPQSEVFDITPIIRDTGVLLLGLLLFMLVISKVLSKAIIIPLMNSIDRLKELAKGNITDPVIVYNSKDEIGAMTRALDETVTSLRFYVSNIAEKLNDISNGDLTDRMHGSFKGDFVKIKSTFNNILASLIDTFGNINSSAEQVNSGASQVSNGAQALSQGATEQASSIEQLSATIMDISSEIKHNAQSAKNAAAIVTTNNEEIQSCNNEMNEMLKAMDEISDSSYQISKIIKVIDDIAFQTNILALNAAVEAARAGSAGKGFAVVADEVRNLAEKSAQAAKQTTNLIKGSADSVENGTKIAKETADALASIVEKSKNINTLVKNISVASDKQADSIVQINSGIEQISGVVQTNTATAEQSAAASEELSSQSSLLKNMVSKFKLGDKKKLFSTADSMVFSSESQTFSASHADTKKPTNDELAFGGAVTDSPADDEFAFHESESDSSADDEFAFGGTASDSSSDDEFSFSGTASESSADDELAFHESASDNSADDEFSFGGTIDDNDLNVDDEDNKY